MGLGSDKDNPKGIDAAVEELGIIAGQKPVITKAKEVRCKLQSPSGHERRRKGYPPR